MTSNRFFIDNINLDTSCIVLKGEEHHHLKNVARIKPGEKVWLIDESGNNYMAHVDQIKKNLTQLSILIRKEKKEPKVKVTLAQALIKAQNFELVLQKATELGIWEFLPVATSRSLVKIDRNLESKMARWRKIARQAAKQSGVFQIPHILQPQTLQDVVRDRKDTLKIFLHESGGRPMRQFLAPERTRKRPEPYPLSVLVMIGPEGGWTEAEEDVIVSHGFEAISLGRQTLRAETAAISSLAMIDHFWNQ